MRNDPPIPHWLKQKSKDYPVWKNNKSGNFLPAIAIGTLVSYFGLMALQKSQPQIENSAYSNIHTDNPPGLANVASESVAEEKKTLPRNLTDKDLALMEPQLMEIHRHIKESKPAGDCDNTLIPSFSRQRMIMSPRYAETFCYAEASQELAEKLNDNQYLELAIYYYRRCLFLIDGQIQGVFKKPKGGDEEVKQRQLIVYRALDSLHYSKNR